MKLPDLSSFTSQEIARLRQFLDSWSTKRHAHGHGRWKKIEIKNARDSAIQNLRMQNLGQNLLAGTAAKPADVTLSPATAPSSADEKIYLSLNAHGDLIFNGSYYPNESQATPRLVGQKEAFGSTGYTTVTSDPNGDIVVNKYNDAQTEIVAKYYIKEADWVQARRIVFSNVHPDSKVVPDDRFRRSHIYVTFKKPTWAGLIDGAHPADAAAFTPQNYIPIERFLGE